MTCVNKHRQLHKRHSTLLNIIQELDSVHYYTGVMDQIMK
jgi:hypothetical protein